MIRQILLLMLVMFMGCQNDNSIPITNSYELTRQTPNKVNLFREATITAKDGRVQLLGIMAAVEMKLDTTEEEE